MKNTSRYIGICVADRLNLPNSLWNIKAEHQRIPRNPHFIIINYNNDNVAHNSNKLH